MSRSPRFTEARRQRTTTGVRQPGHVAASPTKPLLIFDGDCNFCRHWIARWKNSTGDAVDYIEFQDASIATRFPEISRDQFEQAVQLIEPDGSVYAGAEAALRSLAHGSHSHWQLWCYEKLTGIAFVAEFFYRLVARHPGTFSTLTR